MSIHSTAILRTNNVVIWPYMTVIIKYNAKASSNGFIDDQLLFLEGKVTGSLHSKTKTVPYRNKLSLGVSLHSIITKLPF